MTRASKITPVMVAHFAVMVTLLGYAIATANPTARSINAYYGDLIPASRVLFDTVLPYSCLIGILIIAVFSNKYPYRGVLIASIPVIIYMGCSVGWVLGTYGTDDPTNPIAAVNHVSMVGLIYAIAWMGSYYADRTD